MGGLTLSEEPKLGGVGGRWGNQKEGREDKLGLVCKKEINKIKICAKIKQRKAD